MITFRQEFPKVAYLTTYNQPCGLAAYASLLIDAIKKRDTITPLIFAEKIQNSIEENKDEIIRIWSREQDGGRGLPRLIQEKNIEILHVNHGGIFPLGGWLVNLLQYVRTQDIKIVTTFHTTEAKSTEIAEIARLSDAVTVHFPHNKLQLIALGVYASKISVIPIGMRNINTKSLAECKAELNWNKQDKLITTFGFIERHKGIVELIEEIKPLCEENNIKLLLAGNYHPANPDGRSYLEACKRKAHELGLAEQIIFTDAYLDDATVFSYLCASDVIVMNYKSNRYEASLATSLALSSGRPVVSTTAPSFDFPISLTYKVTEQHPLGESLKSVLFNELVRFELLTNVKAYYTENSWEKFAEKFLRIYRSLLQYGGANYHHKQMDCLATADTVA